MAEKRLTRREFVRNTTVAAAGLAAAAAMGQSDRIVRAGEPTTADTSKILNYNPNMEYRKLGKTGLMVSAVCMGGHWKRIDKMVRSDGVGWLSTNIEDPEFQKNRYDVVTRCIEAGINYIDACWSGEVIAYTKAVKGRRDKIYMGFSWGTGEMRFPDGRPAKALMATLENGLKTAGLDYADLWRITMHEQSGKHTEGEVEEMMKALETAKKQGKARFTGFSSHDRPHINVRHGPQVRHRRLRHQALRLQLALQGHQRPGRCECQGRRRARAAGDPIYPVQPGRHGADSGPRQPAPGGQRCGGRGRAAEAGRGGNQKTRLRHGRGVGEAARRLSVAEGLRVRLR